ncbi:MAG: protein TolQ [Alphaproteobacteria bacterium]|nr:protein TolQ [Alphaproteobacteria bacterium]
METETAEPAAAAVEATSLAGSVGDVDLSLIGLVLQADVVVKVVVLVLALASVWCWAIIIEKATRLRRLGAQSDAFEEAFWSGGSLEDLYDRIGAKPDSPMALLFASAMREWRRSAARGLTGGETLRAGVQSRIGQVMQLTMNREMESLERYLGFLATVGSTAPFIGLFGTVWGIMNSFQSIALTKNTSLAVVAPGIAEALFATALGLVAAIPAVVAYNKFSSDLGRYANRLESFAGEFSAILSRQLDERSL